MSSNPKLSIGDPAPDFELETDSAGTVSLEDYRGEKLVLYFYPRDMTPGCTTEACDFRDNLETLQGRGWNVLGISPDSIESHEEFREKYNLNFPLASDPDHEVADRYGVWREKENFGRTYEGIVRSTFLIDEEGEILDVRDGVRATGHVERLLSDLPGED
ncbi:MAG: thioredoxin-dependent thiol peroxidase [Bradymonadaceae bacterium]